MNKGLRTAIILLLIVVAGGYLYTIFRPAVTVEGEDTAHPEFGFKANLATKYGDIIPIMFEVKGKDVAKIDLIFNDSTLNSWTNPSGKIVFDLDASFFGLGAKEIVLQSTMKNGNSYSDRRLVRILSDVAPEQLTAKIVKSYPHNTSSFTQGLEFSGGTLYESTGQRGESQVMQMSLESGTILNKIGLDANYFGEGITILNDKIYQITWTEQKCFIYDKATLQLQKDLSYTGQGWGLCNDGESIIMSDGSERIVFRNPETFQIERSIEVYDHVGPRTQLNELEYIDGKIYANVWMLDLVLIIDPMSGKVLAEIDGSEISKAGKGTGDVMNGIAYNPASKKLYFTGKKWPKLFEVTLQ